MKRRKRKVSLERKTYSVPTEIKRKKQIWPFKEENGPVALALDHVDGLLDRIFSGKVKDFDEHNLTQLKKLSPIQLKEVNAHVRTTVEGLKGAVSGDDFWMECYCAPKPKIKLALEYLKCLSKLKPSEDISGNIRIRRVVRRKKKEKPPEKLVDHVLFLEKDKETGVTSIHPRELVGAKEMWIYNTKNRKLGCYYAANEQGLSTKGTTILNYDQKESTTKTIRKPAKQIREFMGGRIEWQKAYWKAIKAIPQAIPERLSRETLILKVVRYE